MSTSTDHMTSSQRPKVSVCVITYNQERYIRKCLQSLVEQQTDFEFEIIVGDDCSTDGTRAIVMEFAQNYPGVIRTILQENNTGGSKNNLEVHAAASGEYVAHVDGDDYALPGKLQAQADFLDQHPDCNIAWHRVLMKNEASGIVVEDLIDVTKLPASGFRRADLLQLGSVAMHSSKMYRARYRAHPIPPFPVMDFFTDIYHIDQGEGRFISNKPYGVYRVGIGIASASSSSRKVLAQTFWYLARNFPEHRRSIAGATLLLTLAAAKNGRRGESLEFAKIFARNFDPRAGLDLFNLREIISMLRIPRLVRHRKP